VMAQFFDFTGHGTALIGDDAAPVVANAGLQSDRF